MKQRMGQGRYEAAMAFRLLGLAVTTSVKGAAAWIARRWSDLFRASHECLTSAPTARFLGLCDRLMPSGVARSLTSALETTFADHSAGRAPTVWGARSARTKSRLKEGSQLLNVGMRKAAASHACPGCNAHTGSGWRLVCYHDRHVDGHREARPTIHKGVS